MEDKLGESIKKWEKEYESRRVLPIEPLLVRIDGKSFSRYTKRFQKPFSKEFAALMISTARSLCELYKPDIAYVQSDEISFCFLPKNSYRFEHIFGGRTTKVASVFAGYASSFFTREIVNMGIDGYPHFDGRAFTCIESNLGSWRHEVALYFLWRHKDATRNGIQQYAQSIFSQKQLQGVKTVDVLKMIGEDRYNLIHPHFRLGSFLFRDESYGELSITETGNFSTEDNMWLEKSYHKILEKIKKGESN